MIDTAGFDDPTTDRDAIIISELVDRLKKDCDFVNLFVIAVNGTNPRIDGSLLSTMLIFKEMFGHDFWKQVVVLFTNVPMDKRSKDVRMKGAAGQTDDQRAEKYTKEVAKAFKTTGEIGYVFLDALFVKDDPEEKNHFDQALEALHTRVQAADDLSTDKVREVETQNAAYKREIAVAKERSQNEAKKNAILEKTVAEKEEAIKAAEKEIEAEKRRCAATEEKMREDQQRANDAAEKRREEETRRNGELLAEEKQKRGKAEKEREDKENENWYWKAACACACAAISAGVGILAVTH